MLPKNQFNIIIQIKLIPILKYRPRYIKNLPYLKYPGNTVGSDKKTCSQAKNWTLLIYGQPVISASYLQSRSIKHHLRQRNVYFFILKMGGSNEV